MPQTFPNSASLALALGLALLQSPSVPQAPPGKATRPPKVPAKTQRPAAPRDPRAEALRLNTLGAAYMNQQQPARALQHFEQAYSLDAKLLAARLNQGIALLNLQRLEAARAVLEEVTAKDPQSARAWYNLGLLERASGETAQALAAFQRAAALAPDDPDAHYFVATLHADLQQPDAALAFFNRAIQLNPFHVSAEFGLARLAQRTGRPDEARAHLARFQHLTQEKLGAPLALAYGDQGALSLAEQVASTSAADQPAVPVKFSVVPTSQSGLKLPSPPKPPKPVEAAPPPKDFWEALGRALGEIGKEFPKLMGPGACALDFDRDGWEDVLIVGWDSSRFRLFQNQRGRFFDVTSRSGLRPLDGGFSCSVGDYDNDGWPDIILAHEDGLRLFHNTKAGSFEETTAPAGFANSLPSFGARFWDFDHDGDLDLFVIPLKAQRESPSRGLLWRNNGNSTFTDVTKEAGLGSQDGELLPASAAFDYNNDRAVDLVATIEGGAPFILKNPREGAFQVVRPWTEEQAGSLGVPVAADFDRDGWTDVAFSGDGTPLFHNQAGRSFESIPMRSPANSAGIAALDYDNDGWVDIVTTLLEETRGQIRALRNHGPAGFEDVSAKVGFSNVRLAAPRSVVSLDFDNDGDADLLITEAGGSPVLLRNDGGNKSNWLKLSLKGLADNKSAIGTKVEVFAGGTYQKFEVQSSSGYLGQNAPDLLIGLGKETKADVVRLLWPTGVLQDEIELAANRRHVITEIDRRGSSCPIIFTWNGSRYEFISDAIGPGIVGHWVAPGERNVSDPTEYIRIPGASLRPRSGPESAPRLSVRFMEPMEELVYLDQLRLLAVDHPADADVYPNERFYASGPPFPDGRVIASQRVGATRWVARSAATRDKNAPAPRGAVNSVPPSPNGRPTGSPLHAAGARLPIAARDHRGRDVLPLLARRDRRYVTDFADAPYKGFAELHWIELDLGDFVPPASSRPAVGPLHAAPPSPPLHAGPRQPSQPRIPNSGHPERSEGSALDLPPSNDGPEGNTGARQAAPLRLLLHGYTDYFTATSVYGAHQAGVTAIVPYVEALDAHGRWVRIEDDMGFPAGLARTMVADLTGKLPPGAWRIRIATNLKVYWDQILVDTTPEGAVPVRVTEAPLASAALAFRGYPREVRGTPASDFSYDYAQISLTGPYARPAGHYTRYGDVRALVASADDRFVILGSGDEVAADYDAAGLPPLPAGWSRDYFLYVDGFAKDMDFYAAHAYTVEPLPHHSMGRYPTSAAQGNAFPADRGALEYQLEYNTRPHSGRPPATYRWIAPTKKSKR